MLKPLFVPLLLALAITDLHAAQERNTDLSGKWSVRLDESDRGLAGRWFANPLATDVTADLPGTLAASGLGHPFDSASGRYGEARRSYVGWPSAGYSDETRADELGSLVPSHFFLGVAWYERSFSIPDGAAGRPFRLTLERVKWTSRLWVDGVEVEGEGVRSLHTPHVYQFVPLTPGPHRMTLRIDNRSPLNIGLAGHGYGMETEPIWHGVAGAIELQPLAPVRVQRLIIRPAADRLAVDLDLTLAHEAPLPENGRITLSVREQGRAKPLGESTEDLGETIRCTVQLRGAARPWDEFQQPSYEITWAILDNDEALGSGSRSFAFRDLQQEENRLVLNGIPLFLRGNLDCAIHPETETPPTGRAWWVRVLGIHKRAGFNHIRFHTWCPPEVAFEVADELGLYLQVETAYWVDDWVRGTAPFPPTLGEDAAIDAWVLEESKRMLRIYGHHPSFAFFCLGNEFGHRGTDWNATDRIVAELREETGSVLISGTTARKTGPHDQYWVTHATPEGAVRGIGPAHTDWDFSKSITNAVLPTISHETGQRQSWPDYDALLPAFSGVVQGDNLIRLKERAEGAGITDHRARCEASVLFAHLLYKAEHEGMRRTSGLAGYQLLMLHDFTGQGEAHVGLLDPFFREKPGIKIEAIHAWNGPTVPLACFPSYTWTTDESFTADLKLAHQGPQVLRVAIPTWSLHDRTHDRPVASGELARAVVEPGSLTSLGSVSIPLDKVTAPARLDFSVTVGSHTNSWPLWAYSPKSADAESASALTIAHRLDKEALASLARGVDVLLLFHKGSGPRFRQTRWESTYWTGAWGWGSGLGLMCDPSHAALAAFPNAGHSNWQWRELAAGGTCISLDPEQAAKATLVEQLSTFHKPVREAFLVEAQVGKGRLLACGFDLEHGLDQRHAARAFRTGLFDYAKSDSFRPALVLTPTEAARIFALPEPLDAVAHASSEATGHEAGKAIDGDPSTIWHTPWGAIEPPHPHELIVEFKESKRLQGVRLKARSGNTNGRLAEVSLFVSDRNGAWGEPVLDHVKLVNTDAWQALQFPPAEVRFLRLVTHREFADRAFASLAELQPIVAR